MVVVVQRRLRRKRRSEMVDGLVTYFLLFNVLGSRHGELTPLLRCVSKGENTMIFFFLICEATQWRGNACTLQLQTWGACGRGM